MRFIFIAPLLFATLTAQELYSPLPQTVQWNAPSDLAEIAQRCLNRWNAATDNYFTFEFVSLPTASTQLQINERVAFVADIPDAFTLNEAGNIRVVYLRNNFLLLPNAERLLMREIGHAFGLGVTDSQNLYGYLLPNYDEPIMRLATDAHVLSLHTDDIYRIRKLYGLSLNVNKRLAVPAVAWIVRSRSKAILRKITKRHNGQIITLRGQTL